MPLRLKSCPRCKFGDLVLERDLGAYQSWTCLQCGHEAESSGRLAVSAYTRTDGISIANSTRTAPKRQAAA